MPYTYDPDALGIVPEGTHVMTVDAIKETDSSKGDPMWIVEMTDKDGNELTEFIVHKPNIIDWKFRPLWEAAGLQWPQGRAVIDEMLLIDRQVLVTVKHERSEQFGLQARVSGVAPVGTSTSDITTPADQAAFEMPEAEPVGAAPRNAINDTDDEPIPF